MCYLQVLILSVMCVLISALAAWIAVETHYSLATEVFKISNSVYMYVH